VHAALAELIEALKRASTGELVSLDYARAIRFRHPEASINEFANECWRRLVNFCDDEDIRSRDPAYDNQMKQEMRWRAQELSERSS
jgi:hypothetical protein